MCLYAGNYVCVGWKFVYVLAEIVEGLCAKMMMSAARNRFANQFSQSCFAAKVAASSEPVSLLIFDINLYRGEINASNKFVG